jgi:DNA-directed RNA polymerase subunit K/omega
MPPKNLKKIVKEESDNEDTEYNDEEIDDEVDEEVDDEEDDEYDEEEELPDDANKDCEIYDAIQKDNIYFDNDESLEVTNKPAMVYVSNENRISSNRLTKYEMVRILGERTKQLTMGAKPLIKNYEGLSYDRIAEEEFTKNMTPYKIIRPLPNGMYELWSLDELVKDHLLLE